MYTTCADEKASQKKKNILTSMTRNCHLIFCSANPAFTTFLSSSCCFSDATRPNKKVKENNTTGLGGNNTKLPISSQSSSSMHLLPSPRHSFFFRLPAVNASQPLKWFRELVETRGLKLVYYIDASIASSNSVPLVQLYSSNLRRIKTKKTERKKKRFDLSTTATTSRQ